ncbi:unnamed protein product [Callosobruchus maculatus]|uniref:Dynein heavy chain region D6 P-loop domain-containing protein n=1 Tax=Callosobruchus maculatus TaxID=64391 RepID=A0A653C491_CALMS|nr:unnamed protein product [Callosobruchus maculatus]
MPTENLFNLNNINLFFWEKCGTFIEEKLGSKYVENKTLQFEKSFEEASRSTPIFFILSPRVNTLEDVEELGDKLDFTLDKGNFHNVSLGQGQEVVAETAMEISMHRTSPHRMPGDHISSRIAPHPTSALIIIGVTEFMCRCFCFSVHRATGACTPSQKVLGY